jgi:hypothetical protein
MTPGVIQVLGQEHSAMFSPLWRQATRRKTRIFDAIFRRMFVATEPNQAADQRS